MCSEFQYGDWVIHKFGYDDDGHYLEDKASFRDYFYYSDANIEDLSHFSKINLPVEAPRTSIYGEAVRKVTYTSIKEKNVIDEQYSDRTFECDVPPEFKYIREKKYKWAPAHHRHIIYFDIEVFSEHEFPTPDRAKFPVISIAFYSSRFKKYFVFAWHEEETAHLTVPEIVEKEGLTVIFCKDEIDVMETFLSFIEEYKVDIITGWYSAGYDLPYIINRCQRLGIDFNRLSPIGKVSHFKKAEYWKTYISGLDHVDMMDAIDDLGYKLPNKKLDTAAKEILKDPAMYKLTEVTWRDWKVNFRGFIKYAIRDVAILKNIDEKLGIFKLYCTIQQMTNIVSISEVMYKSSIVDKYILTECGNDYVFPTRRTHTRQSYMGAEVLDPVPGLHENVGVVDYASLYPTSIISFNLSPETYICSEEEVAQAGKTMEEIIAKLDAKGIAYVDTGLDKTLFGMRYLFYAHSHKVGFMPTILQKMYNTRRRIKAQMKKTTDDDEHDALNKHQLAIKLILNSAYGAMGFNYFRLYKPEVADAITFFARQALHFAIDNLNKSNYNVIYGDTDSAFFLQNGNSNEEINEWVHTFNTDLLPNVFIRKYNCGPLPEYNMLEIEYEKDMERIYFSDSKKRYYGIIRNVKEGEDNKYIRGMNIIRKDAPTFLKNKLNILSELAVRNLLELRHLQMIRKSIEQQPYTTIGIAKKFSKPFPHYDKNKPQHLKAAVWANENLGTTITHKDTPYMFYIVAHNEDGIPKAKRQKAICLNEDDLHFIAERSDLFTIDYDTYFAKQVTEQLMEFEKIDSVKAVLEQYKESIKK